MRTRIYSFILFMTMVITNTGAAQQSGIPFMPDITGELKRLEAEFGGHLGMMAKDLRSGAAISYNASERFPTASVIKFPIMTAFFHLVDEGRVDPNMNVVLTAGDKKGGSGILQYMSDGTSVTLLDAVRLMIILSDNTGTNLVLDRLAPTHEERLKVVNDYLVGQGLHDTRLLNRLMTWQTKARTPEAIRYGIGVATPADMVLLLEGLYKKTIASPASCDRMLEILKQQHYSDVIPRFLPSDRVESFWVGNKTGSINETKVDVGIVESDRLAMAIAIFVDKHPDHASGTGNRATLLAAHVARAAWNHFTGDTGYDDRQVAASHVDWNWFPGGRWAIYRSPAALFPHKDRMNGFTARNGTHYPYFPHYADSSITVFVPEGFVETAEGTNLIVHFHGHMNDNMGALERYMMPQTMIDQGTNALLVLAQGPYRARDSHGGKMEDEGGFKRLVDDVLATMQKEDVVKSTNVNKIVISAHSGGYRPAAFALARGGMQNHITHAFLFDALYGEHQLFREWLQRTQGIIHAAYTDHLEGEHREFAQQLDRGVKTRFKASHTTADHEAVVQTFFGTWLGELDAHWKPPQDAK